MARKAATPAPMSTYDKYLLELRYSGEDVSAARVWGWRNQFSRIVAGIEADPKAEAAYAKATS